MFPLFPHSLCLSQGGGGGGGMFHIHSLPSLISHVCGFSRSPSQSDCSSRVQGLPLSSVLPPQRQSNKGLRQRKRERETIKGKRRWWWWWWQWWWWWWLAGLVTWWVVVVGGDCAGWEQQASEGNGVRAWERQRQWGADWDSKKGKQH